MSTVSSRSARDGVRSVASSPAVAGFRPSGAALAAAALFALHGTAVLAQSTPAGAVHGTATFARDGANLTVTTTNGPGSNHSAINWRTFNVPGGSTTHFQQPGATSTSINRVIGPRPNAAVPNISEIFGTLSSNGKLVLVNPEGIAVGAGGMVSTAGFTASTLMMNEADAIAGRLLFSGGAGAVLNVDGSILASGGDVVLIGSKVQVGTGAVVQADGAAILAAGEKVEITGRGLEGILMQVQAGNEAVNLGSLKGDAVGIFAGTLKHSGSIHAQAVSTEGGRVVLRAAGDNIVAGTVRASALGGKGGQVDVLGERIGLMAGASIDTSGAAGGGQVRIGGDYQGQSAGAPNASAVYVDPSASIKADATGQGHGGRVIVWSEDLTRMHGQISARGGAAGGDGGFAEVSSRHHLEYTGFADLRAPNGSLGTLLLDPQDVTIVRSDSFGTTSGTFPIATSSPPGAIFEPTNSSGSVTLADSHLNAQLDAGNVIVTTSSTVSASSTGGQITVNADAVVSWDSGADLSLQADKGISMLGTIRAVRDPAAPTKVPALHLVAKNGAIDDGSTGLIEVPELFAFATNANGTQPNAGKVLLDNNHQVEVVAGRVDGAGAAFRFNNIQPLVIGNVTTDYGGGSGIAGFDGTNPAIINISSTGGLTVAQGASVVGGSVTLKANGDTSDLVVNGDVAALADLTLTGRRSVAIEGPQVFASGPMAITGELGDVRIGTALTEGSTEVIGDSSITITAKQNVIVGTRENTDVTPVVGIDALGLLKVQAITGDIVVGVETPDPSRFHDPNVELLGSGVDLRASAGNARFASGALVESFGAAINVFAQGSITGQGEFLTFGSGAGGATGAINLTAQTGSLDFLLVDSAGIFFNEIQDGAHGGNVTLQAAGAITGAFVDASGGSFSGSSGEVGGNGGAVVITSDSGSINITGIHSRSGSVAAGERFVSGGGGLAGNVSVLAKGLSGPADISVVAIDVSGGSGSAATNGGIVQISALNGNVSAQELVAAGGSTIGGGTGAQGGQVFIHAGGNISLVHPGGEFAVVADGGAGSEGGTGGMGGQVVLAAGGTIEARSDTPALTAASFDEHFFPGSGVSARGGAGGSSSTGAGGMGGMGGIITVSGTVPGADLVIDGSLGLDATGGQGGNGASGGTGGQGGVVSVFSNNGRVVLDFPDIRAGGGEGGFNSDSSSQGPKGAMGSFTAMGSLVEVATGVVLNDVVWVNNSIVKMAGSSFVSGSGFFVNGSDVNLFDSASLSPTGGVINAGNFRAFGSANRASLIQNVGQVEVAAGATLDAPVFFDNAGTIKVDGTLRIGSSGTVPTDCSLCLTSAAGTFTNQSSGVLAGNGNIVVDGGLGTVDNFGTIAPGGMGNVGTLTLTGNLVMESSAVYAADILDTASHDTLQVTGTATTGGAFAVSYLSGAAPAAGDSFPMLQAASLDASTLPTVDKSELVVSANSTQLLLSVAAAPAPTPAPAPASPPGPPDQEAAEQQSNTQTATFAQLFIQEAQRQQQEEAKENEIGKDDIVVTETACK